MSYKSVSQLLAKWRDGDQEALRALVPLVYTELRRLAHHYLQGENPDHTLESTALVHEAYVRLAERTPLQLQNRAHFFAVASHLMRQILVDYARRRRRAKRGGGRKLTFDETVFVPGGKDLDLIALDVALDELSRLDAQQSKIVELRFFGGLSIARTAHILDISPATVKRDADSEGRLAVIAVLFETGTANALIDTLWKNIPVEKEKAQDVPSVSVQVRDLLPRERGYFTFKGSLTTPPCSEGVIWYVLRSQATISQEQVDAFAKIYPGNARPIQPTNGREILESK